MRIINLINKAILKLLGRIKGGVFYARKVGVVIGEGCRIYITDFGSEPFLISIGDKNVSEIREIMILWRTASCNFSFAQTNIIGTRTGVRRMRN